MREDLKRAVSKMTRHKPFIALARSAEELALLLHTM